MTKPSLQKLKRLKALNRVYDLQNWNVRQFDKHSQIELLSKKDNQWEAIVEIKGPDHKTLAEYIVSKIKAHTEVSTQLEDAINALKLCLESKDLSWEAEQESEAILRKITK
jgi:hypothetical protein